ncbi:MAG: MFS transporter [Acidobacteria bacterium]|nr:MFS transporter [Acidobacteriota bacterium]
MQNSPEDRDTTSGKRWWIVLLLFAAVAINLLDRGNLSVAAVPLMSSLNLSPKAMGLLLSVFFWTYAALQIPAGYIVDRFGFRFIYALAFVLWSLASASIGLAGSFAQILALRLLLGVAESVAHPLSLSYIKRSFREKEQGLPTGLYVSGMMVGAGAGSLLGGVFLNYWGWRNLFLATGLGALVWLIPWLLLAPKARARSMPDRSKLNFRIPFTRAVSNPLFWGITIGVFAYSYYWFFFLTWMPTYLVSARQLSFTKMGAYSAASLWVMAAMSPIGGFLADRAIARFGNPLFVRKAFVCTGCILSSSVLLLLKVNSSSLVLGILVFSLAGLGLASSNFWSLSQLISPAPIVGRIIGYQNGIGNLAGAAAPLITGFLLGPSKDFSSSIILAGLSGWVAATAILLLFRRTDVDAIHAYFDEGETSRTAALAGLSIGDKCRE